MLSNYSPQSSFGQTAFCVCVLVRSIGTFFSAVPSPYPHAPLCPIQAEKNKRVEPLEQPSGGCVQGGRNE